MAIHKPPRRKAKPAMPLHVFTSLTTPLALKLDTLQHCEHCTEYFADYAYRIAYWVAFGPHGPRTLPPPGENWTIFKYTVLGVAVSGVLFWLIRMNARPAPKTMNAQYQEMTNEYLRVRLRHAYMTKRMPQASILIFLVLRTDCRAMYRIKKQSQSLGFHQRVTRAREWCRANQGREGFRRMTTNEYLSVALCTLVLYSKSFINLPHRYDTLTGCLSQR